MDGFGIMGKRLVGLLSALLLTLPIASCAVKPEVFVPADELQPDVSSSLSGFSLDLFRRVAAGNGGENVFLSPVSIWLSLCMAYNGASGGTAEGMAHAIHAVGVSMEELNGDTAALVGVLEHADPKTEIVIANAVWLNKAYGNDINDSFIQLCRGSYNAEVMRFAWSEAPDAINRWVRQKTGGRIDGLIQPPIPADIVMYLMSGVVFKAPWQIMFDPKATIDGEFVKNDGSQAKVWYLSAKNGNTGYAGSDVTAVRLPYGSGRLEMVAILPENMPLSEFIKQADMVVLQACIDKCQPTSMHLLFPKFKLETEAVLNGELIDMGMGDAFDPVAAEFSGISASVGDGIFIDEVKHMAFIEVNEEGTEAGTITNVALEVATAAPQALHFNRPFLFMICDTVTGAILFMGTMENPS